MTFPSTPTTVGEGIICPSIALVQATPEDDDCAEKIVEGIVGGTELPDMALCCEANPDASYCA